MHLLGFLSPKFTELIYKVFWRLKVQGGLGLWEAAEKRMGKVSRIYKMKGRMGTCFLLWGSSWACGAGLEAEPDWSSQPHQRCLFPMQHRCRDVLNLWKHTYPTVGELILARADWRLMAGRELLLHWFHVRFQVSAWLYWVTSYKVSDIALCSVV